MFGALVIGSGVGGLIAAGPPAGVVRKRSLVLENHTDPGGLTHLFNHGLRLVLAGESTMTGSESLDSILSLFRPTRPWRAGLGQALALLALSCLSAVCAAQTRIDLQGHRGARGLWPENTLPGFERAMELGVTTLELDVVATADDVLVVSHNPELLPDLARDASGRFVDAPGPLIRAMSYEQVRAYDVGRLNPSSRFARAFPQQQAVDGTRVPRLRDLFDRVQALGDTRVRFAIETKITPDHPEKTPDAESFVRLLLAEIERSGLRERVQVLSFDWRVLQWVQKLSPGLPTVYLTAQLAELDNLQIKSGGVSPWTAGFQHRDLGSVPRMVKAAGGTHWSSHWRDLDSQKVREAHALGLKVLAWTVNEKPVMGRMLDLGVDGLVTDRPDLAIELLKERGIGW